LAAALRVSWSGKKKKQKRSKEKHDYYGLLGLGNDRWLATEAQIQKGVVAPGMLAVCHVPLLDGPELRPCLSIVMSLRCGPEVPHCCEVAVQTVAHAPYLPDCPVKQCSSAQLDLGAAYRKKALEHHPDKALAGLDDEGDKEAVQQHFLLIQVHTRQFVLTFALLALPSNRQLSSWLSTSRSASCEASPPTAVATSVIPLPAGGIRAPQQRRQAARVRQH